VSATISVDSELPVTSPSDTRAGDGVAETFSGALVDGTVVAGAVDDGGSPAFPASDICVAIRFKLYHMNKCCVALLRPYLRKG
jgi:hypothetical protein